MVAVLQSLAAAAEEAVVGEAEVSIRPSFLMVEGVVVVVELMKLAEEAEAGEEVEWQMVDPISLLIRPELAEVTASLKCRKT